MTVSGYVDSDDMVCFHWRCSSHFNVALLWFVMPHCFIPIPQLFIFLSRIASTCNAGTTLISNSMRTTSPPGRCAGWDESLLMRPKPGSRDCPAYFAVLTLFESWPFVKSDFCSKVCCVVSSSSEIRSLVFRNAPRARRGLLTCNHVLHFIF